MGAREHCSSGAHIPEADGKTWKRSRESSDEGADAVDAMLHGASKVLGEGNLERDEYELGNNEGEKAVIGLKPQMSKVGGNLDTNGAPRGWGVAFRSIVRMQNLPTQSCHPNVVGGTSKHFSLSSSIVDSLGLQSKSRDGENYLECINFLFMK